MKLEELNNWTIEELETDINAGGKFVIYTYVISILIMTFKRPSDIYYVSSKESALSYGWQYMLISFILGWWGFPWGPIYTIQSMWYGIVGKDITDDIKSDVMLHMRSGAPTTYDTSKLLQ